MARKRAEWSWYCRCGASNQWFMTKQEAEDDGDEHTIKAHEPGHDYGSPDVRKDRGPKGLEDLFKF